MSKSPSMESVSRFQRVSQETILNVPQVSSLIAAERPRDMAAIHYAWSTGPLKAEREGDCKEGSMQSQDMGNVVCASSSHLLN